MRVLILISMTLLTVSCASKTVYNPVHTDSEFKPYIENWKLNTPNVSQYLKDIKREIPITFTMTQPSYVGYCQLNKDTNKRKIYVNKKSWNMYPDNREKWVSDLLTICYSHRVGQEVYFDVPYNGKMLHY